MALNIFAAWPVHLVAGLLQPTLLWQVTGSMLGEYCRFTIQILPETIIGAVKTPQFASLSFPGSERVMYCWFMKMRWNWWKKARARAPVPPEVLTDLARATLLASKIKYSTSRLAGDC